MLENKIGHKKKKIKSHEIRVFHDAEYDPGIKQGGLSGGEEYIIEHDIG